MKPEHKQYILENIDKKSIEEIAKELGVKERNVRRVLKKARIREKTISRPARGVERKEDNFQRKIPGGIQYTRLSERFIFLAIVAVAFIVRLIYLNQIKAHPLFIPFYRGLDDFLYDYMAQDIAKGNVLGNEVFHGLPLYPYFLGMIYAIFGRNVFIAKTIQVFIGSLSCGLVYLIGRRIFNRTVGILAATMLAFYAMGIFFEGFFVSAFLAIFLNNLVVLLLLSIDKDNTRLSKWILLGFLIGLSSLANASIFVFLPFLIFWAFNRFKGIPKDRLFIYLSSLLLTVVLTIAPVTLRNYIVGRDFVPITAHAGITFYAGNNPLSIGSFQLPNEVGTSVVDSKDNARIVAERAMKKKLKPSEISRYWFNRSFDFIKASPYRFLTLLIRKAFLFWNAHEIPDVLPFFFFKQYAPLLRMPLVNFSIVCPLALFGIFLCSKLKRRDVDLLYLFTISIFLSTLIYFVNSRYRLIAVPYLVIFAGVAVYWVYNKIVNRRFGAIIFPSIAIFIISLITHVEIITFKASQAHNNFGISLKRKGMYEEAIKEYKRAIELDPEYSSPYYNLGLLHLEKGQFNEAIAYFDKTLQINPHIIRAYFKIGIAYFKIGEKEKARGYWQKCLELDPDQKDVRMFLEKYSH